MKILLIFLLVLSVIFITEGLTEPKREKRFNSKFKKYIKDTIYSLIEEPNPIFKKNKGNKPISYYQIKNFIFYFCF